MQLGQTGNFGSGERQRVETVVQTLAALGCQGESLAEVAHDARNMVTALGLYCDLLEEPGVLALPFAHYGSELRLVAAASRRLVEKLVALDTQRLPDVVAPDLGFSASAGWPAEALSDPRPLEDRAASGPPHLDPKIGPNTVSTLEAEIARSREGMGRSFERSRAWERTFTEPVSDLAAELLANRNLLAALSGPGVSVTVDAAGGGCPVRLSAEDLTRLLVNLVKNAAEAMPSGGQVQISLRERPDGGEPGSWLEIAVEDSGPGIAPSAHERIFEPGFTTHTPNPAPNAGWPTVHRGLGLAISRSLVEASGGRISASNRAQGGARFLIELPVRPS